MSAIFQNRSILLLACALLLTAWVGCRAPDGMESSNPYERAAAAVERAEAGDLDAVHRLVGLLSDEDDGVRLYAILSLEKLCGTTMGYRYYDDEPARLAAIKRWQHALQNGEVHPKMVSVDSPGNQGRTTR